ncbi:MAG: hypothetical protein IJ123_05455 [Blautia sp.]|nr:hypothetical protein [Blautia sp.]
MKKKIVVCILAAAMVTGTMPFAVQAETAEAADTAAAEDTEESADAAGETEDDSLSGLLGKIMADERVQDALFGDEGLVTSFLGEDSPIAEYIPDKEQAEEMVNSLKDQLSDSGSELYQEIEGVVGSLTNEDGSIDLEKAGSLAQTFLGGLFGGSEGDGMDGDFSFDIFAADDAVSASVIEQNADAVEQGDVQICVPILVGYAENEDGTVNYLSNCTQLNYVNEEGSLKSVADDTATWFLVMESADDGSYTVTEAAKIPEDDETALQEACEAVQVTTDEFKEHPMKSDLENLCVLLDYMDEHPEYTSIEYDGTDYTAEELGNTVDEQIELFLSALNADEDVE